MMDSHAAPVSFLVSSGTVLDVLNQLVAVSDQTMWIAHYRPSTTAQSSGGYGLMFQLRNAETLTAELESARSIPPNR
jgi:hypothetical protein